MNSTNHGFPGCCGHHQMLSRQNAIPSRNLSAGRQGDVVGNLFVARQVAPISSYVPLKCFHEVRDRNILVL